MQYSQQEKEEALKRRDLSEITNMISDGIDVNTLVVPKNTDALLAAINKENRLFFNFVLFKGFTCKNDNGFLYLHHAIRTHDTFFVNKIIEHYKSVGKDYNEYNTAKDNCLHVASGEKDMPFDIFESLTENKIRWDEQNIYGQTPLHILLLKNEVVSSNILAILKNHISAFHVKDNLEISPLDIIQTCSTSQEWAQNNRSLMNFVKGKI